MSLPPQNHHQPNPERDPIREILAWLLGAQSRDCALESDRLRRTMSPGTRLGTRGRGNGKESGRSKPQAANENAPDAMQVRRSRELHDDWKRVAALVHEFCCGNHVVRAELFHTAYSIVGGAIEAIESTRAGRILPPLLGAIMELAAIDAMRSEMVRVVSSIPKAEIFRALEVMRSQLSPDGYPPRPQGLD